MLSLIPIEPFSVLLVAFAIASIALKNTIHAVLSLIVCFFFVAWIFFAIKLQFLGMLILVAYVGAVAVLFLFTVMMITNKIEPKQPSATKDTIIKIANFTIPLILFAELVKIFILNNHSNLVPKLDTITLKESALTMYKTFAFFIPILAFILFGSVVGIITLTLRDKNPNTLTQNTFKQVSRNKKNSIILTSPEIGKGINF